MALGKMIIPASLSRRTRCACTAQNPKTPWQPCDTLPPPKKPSNTVKHMQIHKDMTKKTQRCSAARGGNEERPAFAPCQLLLPCCLRYCCTAPLGCVERPEAARGAATETRVPPPVQHTRPTRQLRRLYRVGSG